MRFRNAVVFVTGGAGSSARPWCGICCTRPKRSWSTSTSSPTPRTSIPSRRLPAHPRYRFAQADICNGPALRQLFEQHRPRYVMNLAAESHVDRSIDGPAEFIQTNIVGTFTLLQEACGIGARSTAARKGRFRFHHVSTDEVYGSLGAEGLFTETSPYAPNSPYAASKASSDHLVRAWRATYGLPDVITNCSNNYGPYQFPEKLIPLMIINAARGAAAGLRRRQQRARLALCRGPRPGATWCSSAARVGETYNIGGRNERSNIEVVQAICALLDEIAPAPAGPRRGLIAFVTDRPGHDRRYAIDPRRSSASSAGAPPRRSRAACARPCAGTSTTAPGGNQSSTAATGRSGSGWRAGWKHRRGPDRTRSRDDFSFFSLMVRSAGKTLSSQFVAALRVATKCWSLLSCVRNLPSRHRNALFGEIMHDLLDDLVVTRINHAGHHDLEGVDGAAFLGQAKLRSGPEANPHVAAGVHAIRGVVRELRTEISRGFRHCARHLWFPSASVVTLTFVSDRSTLVPALSRDRSRLWRLERSRISGAPLRKSFALHRIRDTQRPVMNQVPETAH